MVYGSETWSLTKSEEHQLAVTERAMERRMLKITKLNHVRNEAIRQQTRVVDVVSKLRWAGHEARMKGDRWTKKMNDWYSRNHKRPVGRPPGRWNDLMRARLGPVWRGMAQDSIKWKAAVDRQLVVT
ncbi:hypothetical protein AB6A40_003205 [Gnathostoma spinigerum]|uniref:Endonuclease-reverse transcriptase n=1 Tax=Gnathostoma spinigerum TaxID=75299 RepID=A0ABD6EGI3_9BILA